MDDVLVGFSYKLDYKHCEGTKNESNQCNFFVHILMLDVWSYLHRLKISKSLQDHILLVIH
jgi:hypothetical protein